MNHPPEQLEALKQRCSGLASATEGGLSYLELKSLQLPSGCTPSRVDALLCVSERDGYPSRLFFATMITKPERVANWNSQNIMILNRTWHAYSFKLNNPPASLEAMLLDHLTPFR
jgi:hypothetical protein